MADDNYVAVLRRYNNEEEKYAYNSIAYSDTAFHACIGAQVHDYQENDIVFVCKTSSITLLPYEYDHLYIFASRELVPVDMEDKVFSVYDAKDEEDTPHYLIQYLAGGNDAEVSVGNNVIFDALEACMIKKYKKETSETIKKTISLLKSGDQVSYSIAPGVAKKLPDEARSIIGFVIEIILLGDAGYADNFSYVFWYLFVSTNNKSHASEYANIVRSVIPIEKFLRSVVGR